MKNNFPKVEKVYTVLELNNSVRRVLKSEFPQHIWVCGEMQDFRASRDRRHIYFSLVQKHPEIDQIVAKVNAAIFEGRKQQIFKRLKEANASFELKNDIEVKLLCEVDLYPKSGNFNIIIVDIDPIYTLGKIAQSRQKIIEDLRKRGLIDKNKLKEIALLPLRIGLITASNSAAYHDFTNELKLSGYGFKVFVCNCHMQGELVEKDIIKALSFFNSLSKDALDVIVITRGGGSTADLSWFDNKKIAESVASSKFAVISALGHEINITITDIVAHTSCKTPTKAAQFLIEKIESFTKELDNLEERILSEASDFISYSKEELQKFLLKMDALLPRYFRDHREDLLSKERVVLHKTEAYLSHQKQTLMQLTKNINTTLSILFKHSKDNLRYINDKVQLLNPRNVLKRGYSITMKNDKAIKNIDDIQINDTIRTVLYKGDVLSQVKGKEHKNG